MKSFKNYDWSETVFPYVRFFLSSTPFWDQLTLVNFTMLLIMHLRVDFWLTMCTFIGGMWLSDGFYWTELRSVWQSPRPHVIREGPRSQCKAETGSWVYFCSVTTRKTRRRILTWILPEGIALHVYSKYGKHPLMEHDPWWKTGRLPLMEDDLLW